MIHTTGIKPLEGNSTCVKPLGGLSAAKASLPLRSRGSQKIVAKPGEKRPRPQFHHPGGLVPKGFRG